EPVDWAREGFYYDPEERPGKSALHEAGAFYIQEPSAMSAVEVLDPQPGD
ncbi:MAG: RNA methyltransferase, partial [Lachnospiraceae bacterium]|nr:RNA methyltransferase [Lachnospiraceae bacterium]